MIQSHLSQLQGLLIALVSGAIYYVTYRVNALFDSWAAYAQGISLIFLPAGIKQISILIAGKWGALGCLVALFVVASEIWSANSVTAILLFSVISIGATWLGVSLALKFLRLNSDLSNLKFIHLPVIDLITTSIHALATNAYLVLARISTENFWSNALAMVVGDYVGCFIILALLYLGLRVLRKNEANL